MKLKIVFALFVMSAMVISYNCEKENKNGSDFSGKLTAHTGCTDFKSTGSEFLIPDTLSCVEYTFKETNSKLIIKHINAGFNCCPESLYCDIELMNDTIFIHEHETDGLCDCLCLFDLDIEITNVETKKYQVKFIEPYSGSQETIEFEINLIRNHSGSVCVTRKKYPWGIYN